MKMQITAAALAFAALTTPSAGHAHHEHVDTEAAYSINDAEAVRELNLMLMATSLRCRQGRFDFRPEYEVFSRLNLNTLNRSYDQMRRAWRARYGAVAGDRALDRFDTDMANRYGGGHPWMNCAQLRDVVIWLAAPLDRSTLADVAWDLVKP